MTANKPHPSPETDDRDPVEALAEEFLDRQRDGEFPSIDEYAKRHPELAEEIRELFPMIAQMEQLKQNRSSDGRVSMAGTQLTELGDFRIIGEVGRGGMGIVYEAEQKSLGRHVAVKVLPKQSLLNPRQLQRFQREAQAAARLHHTNIVPVFGVGEHDGFHYIVMQFIAGVGLDEVIGELRRIVLGKEPTEGRQSSAGRASHVLRNANSLLNGDFESTKNAALETKSSLSISPKSLPANGPSRSGDLDTVELLADSLEDEPDQADNDATATEFTIPISTMGKEYWQSVAKIGEQSARALEYAHRQGALHRDIKPGNLLLDGDGTVWVADFGLAKLDEHEDVSQTGDIVGTLGYMPPERLRGDTDARSDIYSLGLTLYEMLTLEPAFRASDRAQLIHAIVNEQPVSPRKRNTNIPLDLETIALKAIANDPNDRYQTAGEFADDLSRFLEDIPIHARRVSLAERLGRWCRRNKQVAALSATALSLLILSAALSLAFAVTTNQAKNKLETALEGEQIASQNAKDAATFANDQRERAETALDLAIRSMEDTADKLAPTTSSFVQSGIYDDAELDEVLENETPDFSLSRRTAEILEGQLAFFDEFASLSGDNPNMIERSADAYRNVADKRRRLGQYVEAIAALNKAIEKYDQLQAKEPSKERSLKLARTYNELGDVYTSSATPDPRDETRKLAKAAHRDAIKLLNTQLEKRSNDADMRFERAYTQFMLGTVDRRLRYSTMHAFGGGREGRKSFRGRRGDRPEQPRPASGYPRPDGGPDSRRGGPGDEGFRPPNSERGRDEGRPPEGRPQGPPFQVGLQGRPPEPGQQRNGEGGERRHRNSFRWNNDEDDKLLAEARNELIKLREEHPENANYRYLLARCFTFTRGESEFEKAEPILEKLNRDFPKEPDYQFELARVQLRKATSLQVRRFRNNEQTTRNADYTDRFSEPIEILQKLVAENPNIPSYHQELVGALKLSAWFAMGPWAGDGELAEKRFDQAVAVVDQFQKVAPEQVARANIARADLMLGKTHLLRRAEQLDKAEAVLRDLLSQLETFANQSEPEISSLSSGDRRAKEFATKLVGQAYWELHETLKASGKSEAAEEAKRAAARYGFEPRRWDFFRGRRDRGKDDKRDKRGSNGNRGSN